MAKYWEIPRIWQHGEAIAVGNGPSLSPDRFDWGCLRGRNVVGCNNAIFEHPDALSFGVFGDAPFWQLYRREIIHSGLTCLTNNQAIPQEDIDGAPNIRRVARVQKTWSGRQDGLCWIGNTGAMAINLAALLGAKRIILVGFDMALGPAGAANWYTGNRRPPDRKKLESFAREITGKIVGACVASGVELVNANPESKLGGSIPIVDPAAEGLA